MHDEDLMILFSVPHTFWYEHHLTYTLKPMQVISSFTYSCLLTCVTRCTTCLLVSTKRPTLPRSVQASTIRVEQSSVKRLVRKEQTKMFKQVSLCHELAKVVQTRIRFTAIIS